MALIRIVLAGIGGYGIHYVRSLLQREKTGRIRLVALIDPGAAGSPVYPSVADRPLYDDLAACLRDHPAENRPGCPENLVSDIFLV